MNNDNGGPAFPVQESIISGSTSDVPASSGMSLRDYFAAKAMPIAKELVEESESGLDSEQSEIVRKNYLTLLSTIAYRLADAMIAAREGK